MTLKHFIERPVLASVISILIVIAGILGLATLPVEQYPDIAPPTVMVRASYPGASAETIQKSVVVPLEEAINGVEDMTYITSSAAVGSASISVYFRQGTDPDMAAVNVQNKVATATGQLPSEVTQIGVTTMKRQTSMVKIFSLYSPDDSYDETFLANYLKINIEPRILRIQGVGEAFTLGADYSMRVWLKPDVMAQYKLIPSDITAALAEQNIESATGTLGENSENTFQYTMKYKGRMMTPEEFGQIVISALPDGEVLQTLLDVRNSRYTTTDDATHTANFGFRWVSRTVRLNVGVDVRRRTTDMAYRRDQLDTVVARRWTHALPSARFRYRFSRHEQLELRYRTSVSAPGLASLLDVTDDSDPQRISTGNPSLRPSWTHRLTAGYNRYDPERQRGWNANLRFNRTARSISTAVAYDETTGVRTTRPENINGNWDAGAGLTVHSALGRERRFRLQGESHADYRNSVGFIRTQGQQASQKNTNRTLGLRQRLKGTYRNDWLEVELNARLNYRHSRNELNPATGYDTYHYDFGTRIQVRLPWRMTVETDASLQSRRGYDDRAMNTDELVWNARIAQNFLPKNAATLSLRLHDILRQRTGVSQRVSASGRSDSWNEQIYSYVMLQFTYRLNVFKGERPRP